MTYALLIQQLVNLYKGMTTNELYKFSEVVRGLEESVWFFKDWLSKIEEGKNNDISTEDLKYFEVKGDESKDYVTTRLEEANEDLKRNKVSVYKTGSLY